MRVLFRSAALMIAAMPLAVSAGSLQVRVDAKADLFDAGQAAPTPTAPGYGGGVLPPSVSILPGSGRVLTFSSVTGSVIKTNVGTFGPPRAADGESPDSSRWFPEATTFPNGTNGISGITAPGYMFLAGVFLDDSTPSGPAPASLNYYQLNAFPGFARSYYPGYESLPLGSGGWDFLPLEFAPQLRQMFFIGDGRARALTNDPDSSELAQHRFLVPADATRLFLGFVTHFSASGTIPQPPELRDFGGNTGELVATFSIDSTAVVPLPASLPLLLSALGAFGWTARRGTRA